jgi:hypothetical protein
VNIRAPILEYAKNFRFFAKCRSGCANCGEAAWQVMMSGRWPSREAEADAMEAEKALAGTARARIEKRSIERFPM